MIFRFRSRALPGLVLCAVALGPCLPAHAAITRSGTLHAVVADNFRTGRSTTRYTVASEGDRIVVRPTELAAQPGDRVSVTGELREGRLVGAVEATSASTEALAPGPRKTAVLLVRFPGEAEEPWDPGETQSKVFTALNSASVFYEEESYGAVSLTGKLSADGDVFGWLQLDTSTVGCPYGTWKDAADAAAADEGVDLSGYQHVIYVFPSQDSCSWLGLAPLGGDWAMINGNLGVHPIAHELGHDLGLEHAGSRTCTAGGIRVQISKTCTTNDYGDPFDVMGNIAPRHSSGWNLAKLDILSSDNVETIESSGVYSIHSALHPTSEPTTLRIRKIGFLAWYYLEVRQNGGVFENVSDATTTGVSIRETAEFFSPETLLLDANPATATFVDAPLGVGQTFDDGLVQVKTLSAGGGNATVLVELDEESPTAPAGLTAVTGDEGVQLQWDTSTDNVGVDYYVVFRDGALIDTSVGTNFLDSHAPAGEHTYAVYAEDKTGNRSDASGSVTVTVPAVSGPVCSPGSCKVTYRYTGAVATWTVPAGVGAADFTVDGARGGGTGTNFGGRVEATLGSLTTGEAVTVDVGGAGKPYAEGGAGGLNGGGDGTFGGGGGGFSSIELGQALMLLAAGGGGKGLNSKQEEGVGGSGGQGGKLGTSGANGAPTEAHGAKLGGGKGGIPGGGGASGNQGAGGDGGAVTGASTCPGGAFAGLPGADGSSFAGGGGAAGAGGGGGGGYVGGGQGGGGATDACEDRAGWGGGGGGTSFAAPGLSAQFTGGAQSGDGQVSISYSNPVSAIEHSYTTLPDEKLVVDAASGVLVGASAPTGVPLTASVVSLPVHGAVTMNADGSFAYQSTPGYSGLDSFTYRVTDPSGDYASATVALRVAEAPSASISLPQEGGTYSLGQSVPATFSCSEGVGGTGLASCDDSVGVHTVSGGTGFLDTSTVGSNRYTVTAVSKDGLTSSTSIAYRVVLGVDGSPPPGGPPPGRGTPQAINLALTPKATSLADLLRTGKLTVAVKVSGATKVKLVGRAKLTSRIGHRSRTRLVEVLEERAIRFAGPARKEVRLTLSRRGREVVRRSVKLRLAIAARATDDLGETVRRTVVLTLS